MDFLFATGLLTYVIIIFVVLLLLFNSVFTVKTQQAAIIERFSKFSRVARAGLNFKIPFIERVASRMSLQVRELKFPVETKTEDNVTVTITVRVQFAVIESDVQTAYYKLSAPAAQISSYVNDAILAEVPKLTLDNAFAKKDDVASAVAASLQDVMKSYGYNIVRTLITDITMPAAVSESMNKINAAQRERQAAQDLANADKTKLVTQAQAEAEAKKLQGQGIADQRQAIADGFVRSMSSLQDAGVAIEDITQVLLLTQYFDTQAQFAKSGNSTILLPTGPSGFSNAAEEIRNAVIAANKVQ